MTAANKDVEILVINLDASQDRLRSIGQNLDQLHLNWRRIPAVDGRSMSPVQHCAAGYSEDLNAKHAFRPLSGGEIGCFLSHRAAWQKIVDENLENALILEDDAFPLFENKQTLLDALRMTSEYEIVRMNGERSKLAFSRTKAQSKTHRVVDYALAPFQSTATFITQEGAAKLLAETRSFGLPVDGFFVARWLHEKAMIYNVSPELFGNDPQTSKQTTIQYKKHNKENKLKREVSRMIYRLRTRFKATKHYFTAS